MEIEVATLTSKGQLTIPIAIREKLGLEKGGKVVFLVDDTGVRIANAANLTVTPTLQPQDNGGTVYKSKRRSQPGKKTGGK